MITENFQAGIQIMLIGLAGVFAVLILFFGVTKGMIAFFSKIFPEDK